MICIIMNIDFCLLYFNWNISSRILYQILEQLHCTYTCSVYIFCCCIWYLICNCVRLGFDGFNGDACGFEQSNLGKRYASYPYPYFWFWSNFVFSWILVSVSFSLMRADVFGPLALPFHWFKSPNWITRDFSVYNKHANPARYSPNSIMLQLFFISYACRCYN